MCDSPIARSILQIRTQLEWQQCKMYGILLQLHLEVYVVIGPKDITQQA